MRRIQPQAKPIEHGADQAPMKVMWTLLGVGLLAVTAAYLRSAPSEPPESLWTSEPVTSAAPPPGAALATHVSSRKVLWFEGACDASGAVEVDKDRLAVADDEDNVIRVYDANRGGPPLYQYDFSDKIGQNQKRFESDIEAATRLGERAFFLSSHGRTTKGRPDPHRLLFFAAELPKPGTLPALFGRPYRGLLSDMLQEPRLARFGLAAAAQRPPKEPGGLNIEGMTAASDGSFWIGFRNPVPDGRALLVRLLNPMQVLEGQRARFADPLQLDLGGLGIRSLTSFRSQVLIIAGSPGSAGPSRIYRFDEAASAEQVAGIDLEGLNPEAFFSPEQRDELLVLSDDGTQIIDGKRCKKLRDERLKRFRGMWLGVPRSPAQKLL